MLTELRNKYYNKWAVLYGAVFCFMLIMGTVEIFIPQINIISHFFYSRYALVLALVSYFVFIGLKNTKIEFKLLFIYAIWYLITRMMYLGLNVAGDELFGFYMLLF